MCLDLCLNHITKNWVPVIHFLDLLLQCCSILGPHMVKRCLSATQRFKSRCKKQESLSQYSRDYPWGSPGLKWIRCPANPPPAMWPGKVWLWLKELHPHNRRKEPTQITLFKSERKLIPNKNWGSCQKGKAVWEGKGQMLSIHAMRTLPGIGLNTWC